MTFLNKGTIRKESSMCIQMSRYQMEERIKIESMDKLFEVFNTNRANNGEVTRLASLELKINGHTERIDIVVTDLNGTDMFLEYS